jgi:hypothetical protein
MSATLLFCFKAVWLLWLAVLAMALLLRLAQILWCMVLLYACSPGQPIVQRVLPLAEEALSMQLFD